MVIGLAYHNLFIIFRYKENKDMTNEQLIRLKELLQIVSNDSEVMFKTKSESKDFIISYLQGTIKGVVDIMEDNISLANQE